MIISYATETTKYFELLKHLTDGENYKYVVYSAYVNKNNYAFLLSLAIISTLYLHYYYRKWWLFIASGFIYLNMVFTLSKALLVLDVLLVFAYLVYIYVLTEKEKKTRNACIAGGAGAVILALSIVAIVLLAKSNQNNGGYSSIETRSWIWQRSFETINNTNWVSGAGYKIFGDLLLRYNTSDPITLPVNNTSLAHNMIIESFGNGGILLFLVTISIFGMCIYMNVKNLKINRDLSVISFILIGYDIR